MEKEGYVSAWVPHSDFCAYLNLFLFHLFCAARMLEALTPPHHHHIVIPVLLYMTYIY